MKTISNNRSNAEIAAMIQAESMNDGDILLALCLEKYLTDPSIDTEKISFEEWLTEDKLADIEAFLPDEWMEDSDILSSEDLESIQDPGFASYIQTWDLENEEVCKLILETTEKNGGVDSCPRCGGSRSRMGQSRYARIKICGFCRKDESRLQARNKMLSFTRWHFIKFIKELQRKTA